MLTKFDNAKILGLTATPQRMDGTNVLEDFGGEVACEMRLGDAIVNKILPCPTYINVLYTFDEEIQRVYEKIDESKNPDDEKEDLRKQLEAAKRQLEIALGVPSILAKHINNNGKYLVFCQNIQHLNSMKPTIMGWFKESGFNTHIYEVHTKNPDRETEYKAFTEDNAECVRLCICVDMFNEGVHLDGISGVILLRPTQSSILYLQQIGRALNAGGTQPIIFDLVNNGNCLGAASIRSEIESAIEKQKAESDGFCDNGNDVFDIGCFHVFDYVRDSLDVLRGIENRCFDDWDYHFHQYLDFIKKYGHSDITKSNSTSYKGLCEWCNEQRSAFHKKVINNHRYILLNDNDFIWDIRMYRWMQIYELCVEYLEVYNTPIKNGTIYKGVNLGQWTQNNKHKYKDGFLTEKQSKLLSNVYDIDFNLNDELKDIWNKKYLLCVEYCDMHHKINYNTIYNKEKIGSWLCTQFSKERRNVLTLEQVNKISSLKKFYNEKPCNRSLSWDDKYKLVQECIVLGLPITANLIYKNVKLGQWVYTINKRKYKKGTLSDNQIEKLKEIGITYEYDYLDILDKQWNEKYLLLQEYLSIYNDISVNTIYKGVGLGNWYHSQLSLYNNNKLRSDRVEKLKASHFDLLTSKYEKSWKAFCFVLTKCKTNNIKITSNTVYDNVKIGINLCRYKAEYKKGKFSEERYQQLLSLGVDLNKKGSLMADPKPDVSTSSTESINISETV